MRKPLELSSIKDQGSCINPALKLILPNITYVEYNHEPGIIDEIVYYFSLI